MHIIELLQGFSVPLTNEENDLLGKMQGTLARKELDESEIIVANSLVIKDVLYRKNQDGRITYHRKAN
jgi:hypothetical protein